MYFKFYLILGNFFIVLNEAIDIQLGVLLPKTGRYPFVATITLPAIEYAVETVNNGSYLPGHKLVINYRDSECSDTFGPLHAIDLFVKQKLAHVFIGPACDYAVAPIARFSGYWNVPIISAGAPVKAFNNKTQYRLLTRIQGSYAKAAGFVLESAKAFNWSNIGLLFNDYDNSDGKTNCFFTMEPIFHLFRVYLKQPWYKSFDERHPEKFDFGDLLKQASLNTRSKHYHTFNHSST